ncbi:MAG: type II toxin-antitoxin system RelE/ParE family toxin [Pseudomonadota bacterium]
MSPQAIEHRVHASTCATLRWWPVHEGRIGILHGFIKKTQKTPLDDLDLALERLKEMTNE